MKTTSGIASVMLSLLLLLMVSCNNNSKKSVQSYEYLPDIKVEVSIGGMTCTDCERMIQSNVSKLEGIKSVKASYQTGKAVIELKQGSVDTAQIRKAIEGTGYVVNGFSSE